MKANFYPKLLIQIIFIIVSYQVQAQKDSSIINGASKFLYLYFERTLDTSLCHQFIAIAEEKLNADSIYLPSFKMRFSFTSKKILNIEYKLYADNFSDVVPKEVICFDELMLESIQQKFGTNFLDSIINLSDSLDKVGKGYKGGIYRGDKSIEEIFRKRSKFADSLLKNNTIVLVMTINEMGQIEKSKYYIGSLEDLTEIKFGKYKEDFDKILPFISTWSAAKLRGIPLKEEKIIIIRQIP
jgi:hypothetical protein